MTFRLLVIIGCAVLLQVCAQPRAAQPKPTVATRTMQHPPLLVAESQVDAGSVALPLDDVPLPDQNRLKNINFKNGTPTIPVRLMEGNAEVTFTSKARLRVHAASGEAAGGQPGDEFRIKLVSGTAAKMFARIQLTEVPFNDKLGLKDVQAEWQAKGIPTRVQTLGGVYGVAGKVIDNRRYVVLIDWPLAPPAELTEKQAALVKDHQIRTTLLEESVTAPTMTFELVNSAGKTLFTAQQSLTVETEDGVTPIDIRRVEYGVGYDFHNFENRSYRGRVQFLPDRLGRIAVVNVVTVEDLLRGLVPSEIFAKAHLEALKAQAVTARGEVLAKIGLKHVADPYFLCTEQHCAVYKGVSGETPTTNIAVEATRGEMLFDQNGRLVDSVYSAVCGGHSENNDVVWGGVPNQSLRGRPDVIAGKPLGPAPSDLGAFLASDALFACKVSSFSQASKFRWERRFTAKELDDKVASLNVGHVYAMSVTDRGVSGRARLMTISGDSGATTLRGELTIRRTFGMLNSALFELKSERDAKGKPTAWIFSGGGWGHGVGLCQTGAIGRAEAGQTYTDILSHYFSGAQVAKVY